MKRILIAAAILVAAHLAAPAYAAPAPNKPNILIYPRR